MCVCGGGASDIVPEEKLKASSAQLPPFIVGENSTKTNSNQNVMIYEGTSNIKNPPYYVSIISGADTKISRANFPNFTIAGHHTKIDCPATSTTTHSGITFLGAHSKVFIPRDQQTKFTDFINAGILAVGGYGDVWGEESWSGNFDPEDDDIGWIKRTGLQNSGILMGGNNSTLSIRATNAGIILGGGRTTLECAANCGVVIIGAVNKKSTGKYNEQGERVDNGKERDYQDIINNTGIYIRGGFLDKDGKQNEPSLINVSNGELFPTILKGIIKLDENFKLLNSAGKAILLGNSTKTISQLQARVAELEKQIAKMSN